MKTTRYSIFVLLAFAWAFILLPQVSASVPSRFAGKSVGEIPYSETVTPSGARVVTIPIRTAPLPFEAQEISLVYNSMQGDAVAGYGWSIGGLSSIAIVPKTHYYDGQAAPPTFYQSAYALDGIRLVQNNGALPLSGYGYVSSQGNIAVKNNGSGAPGQIRFTALFPDGRKSVYLNQNGYNDRECPVISTTDRNGNVTEYTYVVKGGNPEISRIRFGVTVSGAELARLEFTYEDLTGGMTQYYAGKPFTRSALLKTIRSYSQGVLMMTYTLAHSESDGIHRLVRVRCTAADGSELPPLEFEYGTSEAEVIEAVSAGSLPAALGGSTYSAVHLRGKLIPGQFSDGLVVYPRKATYASPSTNTLYGQTYGSQYTDQDSVYVYSSVGGPLLDRLKAGSDFQHLAVVDTDGDGTDEIIMTTCSAVFTASTRFQTVVYSAAPGYLRYLRTIYFTVNRTANYDALHRNPISLDFYCGDFLGTGKQQLLSISHNNGPAKQNATSSLSLIDLETGTHTLIDPAPFNLDYMDGGNLLVLDMDGDARDELIHVQAGGSTVYSVNGSTVTTRNENVDLRQGDLLNGARFGDLNGDGLVDVLGLPQRSYQDIRNQEVPIWAPDECPICHYTQPIKTTSDLYCPGCHTQLQRYYHQHNNGTCRVCGGNVRLKENEEDLDVELALECQNHGDTTHMDVDYGYVDNGNIWRFLVNTGNGFHRTTKSIVNVNREDSFELMDMNGDGRADFMLCTPSKLILYRNVGGEIVPASDSPQLTASGSKEVLPVNLSDAGGASGFAYFSDGRVYSVAFPADRQAERMLRTVVDSFGNRSEADYGSMADPSVCIWGGGSAEYPYARQRFDLSLVTAVRQRTMSGEVVAKSEYGYSSPTLHRLGLGFCGFGARSVRDSLRGRTVLETFDPSYLGVLVSAVSDRDTVVNVYDTIHRNDRIRNPNLLQTVSSDALTGVRSETVCTYDAYGNIVSRETSMSPGGIGETVTTAYDNRLNPDQFILGMPADVVTVRRRGNESWRTHQILLYNQGAEPQWTEEYVGTGDSLRVRRTETDYSYGKLLAERTYSYGATTAVQKTYGYDTGSRYLLTETDPFNRTTTYAGYNLYGQPTQITDSYGRTTTIQYDAWGNRTGQTDPDGTVSGTELTWVESGPGVYMVTKTTTGQPTTRICYDSFGREVRTCTQALSGERAVDRTYDSRGRLWKESYPFQGTTPSLWRTYTYDAYDRPVKLSDPSGKETLWSYDGLMVRETSEGVWHERTKDASGALVQAEDAGGVILYTLRADGQPESITAPGGVVTTFTYDSYGRRTSISDPSAGTQTFSETWNPDGSHVESVTDARDMTITSSFDRYGRLLSTVRPEFTTTCTYDGTHPELLIETTSSNGAYEQYTYDSYDRLSTVKYGAPGGKWFKKTFSYSGGNVASVAYTSDSGLLALEGYTYTQGHHSETRLNGTAVWHLTSENELGLPTAATTGPIQRTYGYTQYGLPTYRRAGTVQDFSYIFDAATGNLLARSDNTRDLMESFGYDSLDRLSRVGSEMVEYASNGNLRAFPDNPATLNYDDTAHPYRVTSTHEYQDFPSTLYGESTPVLTYTSFQRPATISESAELLGGSQNTVASFTYGGSGDRVRMTVTRSIRQSFDLFPTTTTLLDRYYLGGNYEIDVNTGIERLFIGGDAYSAPAVYVKENNVWKIYYICRDYQGSITHVVDANGSLTSEYSYTAWGSFRDPDDWTLLAGGSEDDTISLGRGYTGHEYLPWFGLINMNARLYDPALGRFLSPDPYVQAPDFTQAFNRYSYALNNPLKYTDESGEFVFSSILGPMGVVLDKACWGGAINGALYIIGALTNREFSFGGLFAAILTGALNGAFSSCSIASVSFGKVSLAFTFSPQISFGSDGVGIGLSFNFGFTAFNSIHLGVSAGASYFASATGTGNSGFESRLGYGLGYRGEHFQAGVGSTYFMSGKTSQLTGNFYVGGGQWRATYENDTWVPVPGLWKAGGAERDKFRTAAVRFDITGGHLAGATAGMYIFTGLSEGDKDGLDFKETTKPYRMGVLYLGYRNYRIGYNSEKNIRGPIQNGFHDLFSYPHFKVLDIPDRMYYGIYPSNRYTVW